MYCQTCSYRFSCANAKPSCYVPGPPIYPQPWITPNPTTPYYWWMTPVAGSTGDVIIQN